MIMTYRLHESLLIAMRYHYLFYYSFFDKSTAFQANI